MRINDPQLDNTSRMGDDQIFLTRLRVNMKRPTLNSILMIFGILATGCMGLINSNDGADSDFKFRIESRDMATISLEKLNAASTAMDILPEQTNWPANPVRSLEVMIYKEDKELLELGESLNLNEAQKRLLSTLEYSESFNLRAYCVGPNPDNPEVTEYEMFYGFTVVPEKEAVYPGGMEQIVTILQQNCEKLIAATNAKKLNPGLLVFMVSKNGEVIASEHLISSGYPAIDEKLVELMKTLPHNWTPAENGRGEKVAQEFALRFGDLSGC